MLLMAGFADAGKLAFGGSSAFASPAKNRVGSSGIVGQPQYQIGSVDLSSRWVDLVRDGKVAATVQLEEADGTNVSVRYGVRLATRGSNAVCEEFVEEAGVEAGKASHSELIRNINETLSTVQEYDPTASSSSPSQTVKFRKDGDFAAQLQLVRTLRPSPSSGLSESTTMTTSVAPTYDSSVDSFVTGPLRLELRPLVGALDENGLTTPWDVFHNVSPADTRGHFLLLPTLSDEKKNWRGQLLTKDDCNDMVRLTNSIEPPGSLLLGFNSVGAGASQNHIHCHAWPSPPIPLQESNPEEGEGEIDGWNCYAVSKVSSIYDFYDISDGEVQVSYLKYPVFCLQLSASPSNLNLLGQALAVTLDAVGEAPFNIGFLNRVEKAEEDDDDDEETKFVDVFVFARSKERSDVLPSLKLGISETMGVFHAQSDSELTELASYSSAGGEDGPMARALKDISFEDEEDLWNSIKTNLMQLDEPS
jgi:hypothetical protein